MPPWLHYEEPEQRGDDGKGDDAADDASCDGTYGRTLGVITVVTVVAVVVNAVVGLCENIAGYLAGSSRWECVVALREKLATRKRICRIISYPIIDVSSSDRT